MTTLRLHHGSRVWTRACIPATAYAIKNGDILGHYRVDNLSAGGALLSGGPALALDADYQLVLSIEQSKPIPLRGRVVRSQRATHNTAAFGIAFQGVDSDTEDHIHDLVLAFLEAQHNVSPTVLVVDDSACIRNALRRDLRALSCPSRSANMPLDALRLLRDSGMTIDVAIVDLYLGATSGIELLKYLRAEFPNIRRVLISGEVRSCQLDLALSYGYAHAVLPKPWSRDQIIKAIAA